MGLRSVSAASAVAEDPYVVGDHSPRPSRSQSPSFEAQEEEPGLDASSKSSQSSGSKDEKLPKAEPSLEGFINSISEVAEIFIQVVIEGGVNTLQGLLTKTGAALTLTAKSFAKVQGTLLEATGIAKQTVNDIKGVASRVSHDIKDTANRVIENLGSSYHKLTRDFVWLAGELSALFTSAKAQQAPLA